MPVFTMELREVLEVTDNIGLDDYPIFDEAHRLVLNQKIIDHYFNQEIGRETVSMFRLAMSRRMNEIMPYYNQMYESEKIKIDPLYTVDITTESTNESTQESSGTGSTTTGTDSTSKSYNSDYPQTSIVGGQEYATNGATAESGTESTANSSENGTAASMGESSSRTYGSQGNQSDMLARYRETFLNIDLEIIGELQDCFMGIWNTSETYRPEGVIRDFGRLF